jgi:hypothetical protein
VPELGSQGAKRQGTKGRKTREETKTRQGRGRFARAGARENAPVSATSLRSRGGAKGNLGTHGRYHRKGGGGRDQRRNMKEGF